MLTQAAIEKGPWRNRKALAVKQCAFCGGGLGLVSHRKGKLRFCKRAHKWAYEQRKLQEWQARPLLSSDEFSDLMGRIAKSVGLPLSAFMLTLVSLRIPRVSPPV